LNYNVIQNIILGNLIYSRNPEDEVIQSDTSYCVFKQKNNDLEITNTVRVSNSKVEKIEAIRNKTTLTIKYLNFVTLGNYSFAALNEITLSVPTETDDLYDNTNIEIDHNKAEFLDKELNFPFNVPPKFERK
jgi:hypothetical protein